MTRFAGYAAVFDAPDRGGDVVRKGAFRVMRGVPLLWQHGGEPVGEIEWLGEDSRGLRVIEVPVHYGARLGGTSKHSKSFTRVARTALGMLKTICRKRVAG